MKFWSKEVNSFSISFKAFSHVFLALVRKDINYGILRSIMIKENISFRKVVTPDNKCFYIPTDVELVFPEESLPPHLLRCLVYIPWERDYLHFCPKRFKRFFEFVLPYLKPQRTSRTEKKPRGFSEPTATIVWQTILDSGCDPQKVILWNAFPWHPYDPGKGMLSNRKPKAKEMEAASPALAGFLDLFPKAAVIAMGKVSEDQLRRLNVSCRSVRHPAQGGASAFREQFMRLFLQPGLFTRRTC